MMIRRTPAQQRRAVRMVRQRLRATAHDEAGHAVASWAMSRHLGWPVPQFDRVFIRKPEEMLEPYIDRRGRKVEPLGMIKGGSRYNPTGINWATMPIYDGQDPETGESLPVSPEVRAKYIAQQQANMGADVIELLAGPYAEARYSRKSLLGVLIDGGDGDHERVREITAEFSECEGFDAMTSTLWKRAKDLIGRPDVWRAVQALAEALLDLWAIDGDEAVKIIDPAAGWPPIEAGRQQ